MLFILFISTICLCQIIDLNKREISNVSYYYFTSPPSESNLKSIFYHNPKSIIYQVTSARFISILPIDDILYSSNDQLQQLSTFNFYEIEFPEVDFTTDDIPISPCICGKQGTNTVRLTQRTSINSRYTIGSGASTSEGLLVNGSTTLGLTLGYRLSLKFQMEKSVDFTIGCSDDNNCVRIFANIPMMEYRTRIKQIWYFKHNDSLEIDNDIIESESRKIMVENKLVTTYCKSGTEQELNCDAHTGSFRDNFGNTFTWMNEIIY